MNFVQALEFFEEEADATESPEEYREVRARIAVLEIMWRQQEPRSRLRFLERRIEEFSSSRIIDQKMRKILAADRSEIAYLRSIDLDNHAKVHIF